MVATAPLIALPSAWSALAVPLLVCGLFAALERASNKGRPASRAQPYQRAGEYGEYEADGAASSPGALKEPINAVTSLAFSVGGLYILFATCMESGDGGGPNLVTDEPLFSLHYGVSLAYLGGASYLFHGTHSEAWRKADAGMTSGVLAAPLALGIYDRARLPTLSATGMAASAVLLQFSLTHGVLPYGSSDVILPLLVAVCWSLEFLPVWGGPVVVAEYELLGRCAFAAVGGMLMRLVDVKRSNDSTRRRALGLYVAAWGLLFTFLRGATLFALPLDAAALFVWLSLLALALVARSPKLGHCAWHCFAAYSLFVWWELHRRRPGNLDESSLAINSDAPVATAATFAVQLAYLAALKNAVRRLLAAAPTAFSSLTPLNLPALPALPARVLALAEHVFFALLFRGVMAAQHQQSGGDVVGSWLVTPILCWGNAGGILSEGALFQFYYAAKVATHVEDLASMLWPLILPKAVGTSSEVDAKMALHHVTTSLLCLASWAAGYGRIGSLVMYLHDISDIPVDLLRLALTLGAREAVLGLCSGATLVTWCYWRLWYFPTHVLYSVAYDAKSTLIESDCVPGGCSLAEVPERVPFLAALGVLQVLHVCWWCEILAKSARALAPGHAARRKEREGRVGTGGPRDLGDVEKET